MPSSMREIKKRMEATKNTSQITNAMNMVSASKLKKSQAISTSFIPYIEKIKNILINIVSNNEDIAHPLFEVREAKKVCYLVVSSDRGLAGPFNANLFKLLQRMIEGQDYIIGMMGIKGYLYCKSKKLHMIDEVTSLPDDVTYDHISSLIHKIVTMYINKEIDKVVMVYNHFVNTLKIEPTIKTLLPITEDFSDQKTKQIYDYEGGVNEILDIVLPLYIENQAYGIILDSKSSEHASRMSAMSNATDNANNVILELGMKYNRARQAAITLELTDIINGANATSNNN